MNARMPLLCASVILLAMILLGGYCYGQNYIPKANEELYATWTNENAKSTDAQKSVKFPGGYKLYLRISDTKPFEEGTEQISEKWTDSEGNVWYKTNGTVTFGIFGGHDYEGFKWQCLYKFNKSGTVQESTWVHVFDFSHDMYPLKIDPKEANYGIFYRTEK